jgi:ubiquitin carboxyl-terminal hydrolase 4/11/15
MVEVFSNKIYRVMDDRAAMVESNFLANDDMIIYELEDAPTNFPPKKFRSMLDVDKKDDPEVSAEQERQLVTVYNRQPQRSFSNTRAVTLMPTFITLSKEEAADFTEIYRKVLRTVVTLTDRDLNQVIAEATASSDDETSSREDSSDGKPEDNIKTQSLGSESFVDISMEDAEDKTETEEDKLEDGNLPRTSFQYPFLENGAPIPKPLLDMFEIVIGHTGDVIPTSNSSFSTGLDLAKPLPTLRSRLPKPVDPLTPEDSAGSPAPTDASDDTTPDESAAHPTEAQMSYDDYEDGSDMSVSFSKPGGRNPRGKGKGKKGKKGWGKNAGNKYHQKATKATQPASQDAEVLSEGDSSLIRPNEYLCIDWKPDFYDALFIPASKAESRKHARLFEDKELEKRREQREVRRKRGIQLEDCFTETTKEEILTEDNAWYCSNCKELRQASKQLEIWTIPDVLVIHLKRFSLAGRASRDKIDVLVDFPVEGLDLTGRVSVDDGKPLLYDLFAVDNHYGGMGGGHYTAYAKNFVDGEWYDYNGKFSGNSMATITNIWQTRR